MELLRNVQDKIHYENRVFTEKLDKIKREKEQTVGQQVHIQNSLQEKLI